jgi:hypothetical protein
LARIAFTYSILQYIASCGAPYSNLTLLIALIFVLLTYSSCHLLQGLPVFAMGLGLSTFDKASVSIMIKFPIEGSLIQILIWNKKFLLLDLNKGFLFVYLLFLLTHKFSGKKYVYLVLSVFFSHNLLFV